jgi:hypothetical protein
MGPHWGGGAHARNRLMPHQPASQRMKRPLSFHLSLSVSLFMSEGGYASVCTHSAQFNLPRREFNYQRAHPQTYSHRKVESSLMEVIL